MIVWLLTTASGHGNATTIYQRPRRGRTRSPQKSINYRIEILANHFYDPLLDIIGGQGWIDFSE